MLRRPFALLLPVVVALVASLAAAPAPAAVPVTVPAAVPAAVPVTAPVTAPVMAQDFVADVRSATNAARTDRGEVALKPDACLQRAAQRQAERIARQRRLSHTEPFRQILRRCGMRAAGENVAYNSGGAAVVVAAWMGSSGHRANILNPTYRLIGVGAVRRNGTWWVAQVFGRKA